LQTEETYTGDDTKYFSKHKDLVEANTKSAKQEQNILKKDQLRGYWQI